MSRELRKYDEFDGPIVKHTAFTGCSAAYFCDESLAGTITLDTNLFHPSLDVSTSLDLIFFAWGLLGILEKGCIDGEAVAYWLALPLTSAAVCSNMPEIRRKCLNRGL